MLRTLLGCSRLAKAAYPRRVTASTCRCFVSATANAEDSAKEPIADEKQTPAASTDAASEQPLEQFKGLDSLTIGDILSLRETEFTKELAKRASHFDEWKSVSATQTVHDAIAMMVKSDAGSLIVSEENHGIVGIVTERDILKKTSPKSILKDKIVVKDIMSSHIMCIHPSTTIMDALATMSKENFRHLAVIHGELTTTVKKGFVPTELMRCVLSIRDIIQACVYLEKETNKITDKERPKSVKMAKAAETEQEKASETATVSKEGEGSKSASDSTAPSSSTASETERGAPEAPLTPPIVTAAALLKKKHKHIRLILNTRPEDNVTVADAVEAMAQNNFGSVLVVDKENCVLGIFTERDYMVRVLDQKLDPTSVRVIDVSTNDVKFLQYDDSLETCWYQVATGIRHFPVAATKEKERELAGILSVKDIVREISKGHNSSPGFWLMEFFKAKMEAAKEARKEHDAKKEKEKEKEQETTKNDAPLPPQTPQTPENQKATGTATVPIAANHAFGAQESTKVDSVSPSNGVESDTPTSVSQAAKEKLQEKN